MCVCHSYVIPWNGYGCDYYSALSQAAPLTLLPKEWKQWHSESHLLQRSMSVNMIRRLTSNTCCRGAQTSDTISRMQWYVCWLRPLLMTELGGLGPIAKVIYKKLASMVATKHNQSYSQTISWLQCRFSFSLLCSSIMCLRGSCFSTGNPQFTEVTIDRTICDRRFNSETWHELTRT